VPFLTSSGILLADLSMLPLLSKKDAMSSRLSYLQIREDMTLISCSGAIGHMAYTRPEMDSMWSSQDVLKVVPDPDRILPGYLYAFLSSKFGIPLVVGGTYGAVIQHIEPHHINHLPVPRFGEEFEARVHMLMDRAAHLLSVYQTNLVKATENVFKHTGVHNLTPIEWLRDLSDLGFHVRRSEIEVLRAWNHSRRAERIKQEIKSGRWSLLGDLVDAEWLKWRMMFKRIDADPEFGIEVITQRPLFRLFPEGRWISRSYLLNHSPRYVVPDQTILIAKQGTLGEDELYCRCEFVTGRRMLKRAYSDHCMRVVVHKGAIDPGYLFAFLRSHASFRLLRSLSEGSKQQDLHWRTVPTLPIPRCGEPEETKIGDIIRSAYEARNNAVDLILEAQWTVESAIEEAA
jgi:type I restriction enzyme S subunit